MFCTKTTTAASLFFIVAIGMPAAASARVSGVVDRVTALYLCSTSHWPTVAIA